MKFQLIASTLSRVAVILLFILALAGCGDDAGDMDVHVDDHAHEEDEHEAEHGDVIASFDQMNGGFMRGQSPDFTQYLRVTSDGRYGFVLQRSRNLPLGDAGLDDNRIYVVDSGLAVEEHGDHFDPVTRAPSLLPYQLGHGGGEAGEEGLYNPVHFVSHHGLTAIFYDGIHPPDADDPDLPPDLTEQRGVAVAYRNSDFEYSTAPPTPIFRRPVSHYSHGAVVAVRNDLFIVTVAEPGGDLPNGVVTYRAHDHGDHVDIEMEQDFSGLCPRLHGEATWGPYVAFACLDGEGVLVLTYDGEYSFDATVVPYPGMYGSGGLAATTLHEDEVGHSGVIFMARYGPSRMEQDFVMITEHDIEVGLDGDPEDLPEVLMARASTTDRHRHYAFEPVEGSAGRLLVQDADPENYHLDVLHLEGGGHGHDDHAAEGEGRFVVLTVAGDLLIFDLTMEAGDELVGTVPNIVGAECPEGVGCPSFALAPGFAYVSDPVMGKVYEVHLEHAEVEHEFDEGLDAPTQIVVLGRFGYELEESHARHE